MVWLDTTDFLMIEIEVFVSRVYLEVQEAGEEDQRAPQRPGEEGDQSDQQQHVLHQQELCGQQGQHQGGSLSRQGDGGLGQV